MGYYTNPPSIFQGYFFFYFFEIIGTIGTAFAKRLGENVVSTCGVKTYDRKTTIINSDEVRTYERQNNYNIRKIVVALGLYLCYNTT